jgi:hypothetical protein
MLILTTSRMGQQQQEPPQQQQLQALTVMKLGRKKRLLCSSLASAGCRPLHWMTHWLLRLQPQQRQE